MSGQLSLPTEKVTWTINDFVKLNQAGKLVINMEYQRSEVWKLPKKQLLIDSILSDYDIGSIILRQKEDKWEILDGQQRLKAIFDFVAGKFSLSDETYNYGGKKWGELEPSVQWGQFMNRLVYTTKIYSVDDETTSKIFLRVQEGMPLNSAEKLNAMRGCMRNAVYEISQHPFFKMTGVTELRFAYRYLCAQIALLEMGDVTTHVFRDIKFRALKKMYEDYKDKLPPKIFDRMKSTLNFLQNTLGSSASIINKKSDVVSIYLLASYVTQIFAIKGKESKFKDFIINFLQKVETAGYSDKEGYYDYWVARSSSPDSKKQLENRFQIMLRKFLEFEPILEPKDPQRGFDWGQKLTIYAKAYREARQKGKEEAECAICGKPTPLDKGAPDHIKPHNLGGRTTVENGQWTCIQCNSAKRDKY
jgi:5-methylcytosine-specific restriction endonuclease McrA